MRERYKSILVKTTAVVTLAGGVASLGEVVHSANEVNQARVSISALRPRSDYLSADRKRLQAAMDTAVDKKTKVENEGKKRTVDHQLEPVSQDLSEARSTETTNKHLNDLSALGVIVFLGSDYLIFDRWFIKKIRRPKSLR